MGILISKHVTVQAAAEITGILWRMMRSGALKGVKIGQTPLSQQKILSFSICLKMKNEEMKSELLPCFLSIRVITGWG
jgi:hypothetical protein